MQIKIISISNKNEWNDIIKRCVYYDFYHCNSYNSLDKSGDAFLFVAEHDDELIAFPLIKRRIEQTDYFDCTSVWGYPGPVASKLAEEFSTTLIDYFQHELQHYLYENNIISAFSRLHPIIYQQPFIENLGEIILLNKTVAIDTSLPLDVQRQQYQSSNKNQINQLRKKGYTVKKANTEKEIDTFVDIYKETMQRVNATDYYFNDFDNNYFHNLLNSEDYQSHLMLACIGSEIIAGSILIYTNHFMQYHISGTKSEYLKVRPMKLIVDEARLLASQLQLKYLHLGGGVGGSDTDSLFCFKSSFSNLTFTYKTWQLIVNENIYENLVDIKSKEKVLNKNYFPLYRG